MHFPGSGRSVKGQAPVFLGFPCGLAGKESTCNAGDLGLIPGFERSPGEGTGYPLQYSSASPVAQLVKNSLAVQEIWVQSLGWEDPLEKVIATYSNILAWRIPLTVQSLTIYSWTHPVFKDETPFFFFTSTSSSGTLILCHLFFWVFYYLSLQNLHSLLQPPLLRKGDIFNDLFFLYPKIFRTLIS